MKPLFIFCYFTLLGLGGVSQKLTEGYWLPLKRIQDVVSKKQDICDSTSNFPFKKIKFLNNNQISLFGFEASDPSVCTIISGQAKNTWIVKDSIVHTLYSELAIGSKIVIRIEKDTLYVSLTKGRKRYDQIFVKKYLGVEFLNYKEVEVGSMLLTGCYFGNDKSTKVIFKSTGEIKLVSKNESSKWNYSAFVFKSYAPSNCPFSNSSTEGMVELTDLKGSKELFLIRKKANQFDFLKIIERNEFWEKSKVQFSFSIYYCD